MLWRVFRRPGPGEVRIEVNAGEGWRAATLPEIDAALRQIPLPLSGGTVGQSSAAADGGTVEGVPPSADRGDRVSAGTVGRSTVGRSAGPRGGLRRKAAGWNLPQWVGTGEGLHVVSADERDAEIRRRRAAGESIRNIAAALQCGRGTVGRALQRGTHG